MRERQTIRNIAQRFVAHQSRQHVGFFTRETEQIVQCGDWKLAWMESADKMNDKGWRVELLEFVEIAHATGVDPVELFERVIR